MFRKKVTINLTQEQIDDAVKRLIYKKEYSNGHWNKNLTDEQKYEKGLESFYDTVKRNLESELTRQITYRVIDEITKRITEEKFQEVVKNLDTTALANMILVNFGKEFMNNVKTIESKTRY